MNDKGSYEEGKDVDMFKMTTGSEVQSKLDKDFYVFYVDSVFRDNLNCNLAGMVIYIITS